MNRSLHQNSLSLLLDQQGAAIALRDLNETLEQKVNDRTRELESARETLAFALECAEMGSWDLDLVSNEIRHSPQHDRIFGYASPVNSPSRAILRDHVLEDDRRAVDLAFKKATGAAPLTSIVAPVAATEQCGGSSSRAGWNMPKIDRSEWPALSWILPSVGRLKMPCVKHRKWRR